MTEENSYEPWILGVKDRDDPCLLAVMEGVREYAEEYPVQLWRDRRSGRLVIRALNEGSYNEVRIDLWDLLTWLREGPLASSLESADTAPDLHFVANK